MKKFLTQSASQLLVFSGVFLAAIIFFQGNFFDQQNLDRTQNAAAASPFGRFARIASADTIPPGCDFDASATAQPLCGFAWGGTDEGSDTGVGWLSFNSDGLGGPTYKVTVSADGTLRGCAWSPNIGWVKFHDLSDNPHLGASGNPTLQARFDASPAGSQTGTFKGWARACAGTINAADADAPGDCTTMQSRTDGWDGWISLKGTAGAGSYGLTATNGIVSGFSWGSEVVGYMDWNHNTTSGPVRFCNASAFDFNITAQSSVSVAQGEVATIPVNITKIGTGASQPVNLNVSLVQPSSGTISASLTPSSGTPTFASSLSVRPSVNPPDGGTVPPGVYPLTITGTSADGLITRTKVINVNVVSSNTPDYVVTCSAPPPSELPAYVNRPVNWRVTVTKADGSTPTGPFMYRTDFDGVISAPLGPVSGSMITVSHTYTTIGNKVFKAGVIESDGSVSWCTGANILVRVNPDIIER